MRSLSQRLSRARLCRGCSGKLMACISDARLKTGPMMRIMRELGPIEYDVHDRLDCPLIVTDDDIAGTFTSFARLRTMAPRRLTTAEIGETWP